MKIYSPDVSIALDWSIDVGNTTNDLNEISQLDHRIAAVPAMCNLPHMYCYKDMPRGLDLSWFDLVIIGDIEYYSQEKIKSWIRSQNIKNYILAIGGIKDNESIDSANTVYRPWWVYNCLRFNQFRSTASNHKPFQFEMLLGARRPHRDYAMLSFQKAGMLESSVVTYRDIFQGHHIDQCSQRVADIFAPLKLEYPYVSPNLDPSWETSTELNYKISPFIPWEIYRRTNYSVVCETLGMGETFFLSEKAAKVLFGKRLFVVFASCNYLKNLRLLGFRTFEDVIDESYDNEHDFIKRYQMVFEQIQKLNEMDPTVVLLKVNHVLEHNHNQLLVLQQQTKDQMSKLKKNHGVFY